MIPLVAIVGRPNVGKSTLFNRLKGTRLAAIVEDAPGVTRDRHYRSAVLGDREVLLVDTGGFDPEAREGVEALVQEQTRLAMDEADLVLVVLDARAGLLDGDREVARALRRAGKRTLLVVNKVDGPSQELTAGEFYSLGAEALLPISAKHGLGLEELEEALLRALPPAPAPPPAPGDAAEDEAAQPVRVALVGRPNVGKSSLLNRLVGQPRSIVSEVPGTTRDPVDVTVQTGAGPVVLVDTAGIRRKRSISLLMEKYAVIRAMRSVYAADVTCLLLDPFEGVVDQDARIANLALDAGKGLLLVFSKGDLLQPLATHKRRLREAVADSLRFATFAPLHFVSAATGQGVKGLLPAALRVHRACGQRIATAELNRFLEEVGAAHPHPTVRGRPVRFYYSPQPQARPPTFIVITNTHVEESYQRYMANRLRERFGFEGAPVRIFFRRRGRPKGTARARRR